MSKPGMRLFLDYDHDTEVDIDKLWFLRSDIIDATIIGFENIAFSGDSLFCCSLTITVMPYSLFTH